MKIKLFAMMALLLISFPAHAAVVKAIGVSQHNGSFALVTPNYTDALVLAADTAETLTVPSVGSNKANYVSFSATCNFYVDYDATATVPADTSDGTASELNPTIRFLNGNVTTISVISESACKITVNYFM